MNNTEKKLSISNGNRKMGQIKSVSLPPIITCAANCKCAKKCYAAKLCRIYKNVKKAYESNLEIYLENPCEYFKQVKRVAAGQRFFRWHVSGDVINELYLYEMVKIARDLPHTEFLAFTKKYDIVNMFLEYEELPENLHLVFSAWPGMEMNNPHNLPTANVIFKGETPKEGWKVCPGNCLECALENQHCWNLKKGEAVCFYEH